MVEVNRLTTPANMRWKLIDRDIGAENAEIDWRFRVGDQVKIRLLHEMAGDHPMHHPFHVHGAGRFLVLNRDGAVEQSLVWKDTVLVRTGETVDILLDVSNPGTWMAHCHIAEHHESDDVQLRGDGMRLGTQADNHFRVHAAVRLEVRETTAADATTDRPRLRVVGVRRGWPRVDASCGRQVDVQRAIGGFLPGPDLALRCRKRAIDDLHGPAAANRQRPSTCQHRGDETRHLPRAA
jgi:hypothetical protein